MAYEIVKPTGVAAAAQGVCCMMHTYTQKHIHGQQHFIAKDTYSPICTIVLWPGVIPQLKLTKVKRLSELNTLPLWCETDQSKDKA